MTQLDIEDQINSCIANGNVVVERPYNYLRSKRDVSVLPGEERLVEQHHKDACDLNRIVKSYMKTGLVDHVSSVKARYGDFTGIGTYHDCQNKLLEAHDAFMQLPAIIRKEFNNDAGVLLDAIQDPTRRERMIELGLVEGDTPKTPVVAGDSTPHSTDT